MVTLSLSPFQYEVVLTFNISINYEKFVVFVP